MNKSFSNKGDFMEINGINETKCPLDNVFNHPHAININMKDHHENPYQMIKNIPCNESENACLLFLQNFTPLNAFCLQNQGINPKFLNSMLKLIDKYHVPFNLSDQKSNKNDSSQEETLKDEVKKTDNTKKSMYKKFTEEEDIHLKRIVQIFGPKNWRLISSMIPNKTPRQCRDRYTNYLAPGFIHSDWTNEEDKLLAQKYNEFGPKWSKIQQFFPFRTSNSIKNRYKYTICRTKNLSNPKKQNILKDTDINKGDQKINDIFEFYDENINDDLIDYSQDFFYQNYDDNANNFNTNFLNY